MSWELKDCKKEVREVKKDKRKIEFKEHSVKETMGMGIGK
jgi:hypothetical protein